MPQPPNLEGLPSWLQIGITLLFGIVTLVIGVRGYFPTKRENHPQSGETAQILGAQIADMGAVRRLADTCLVLGEKIDHLNRVIHDDIHWRREGNDIGNELCQRMRELRDELERHRPPRG